MWPASWDPTGLLSRSRIPYIVIQNLPVKGVNYKLMLNYSKRRLRHLGVDTVLILDYGKDIQMKEQAVKTGYERMLNRGRIFEKEAFDTFENTIAFSTC
ncbi:hypothetical protein TNIN_272421 [Trichonephila inaurata madagascariensis]|uniref:Uncharacterized protein n=1 Tax=Trichonephila inaurata madagascariensis TaxID=2747483 RepID=A0A8X6X3Y2_9ARAC|nr:hypothetical protein TNIN_272421 [Trichonephila inaurata madagascariensis]